jgi:hypothetical protein
MWFISNSPTWADDVVYRIYDKHRDLKESYAAGEAIQVYVGGVWQDVDCDGWDEPNWDSGFEFRIKPDPKYAYVIIDEAKVTKREIGPSFFEARVCGVIDSATHQAAPDQVVGSTKWKLTIVEGVVVEVEKAS